MSSELKKLQTTIPKVFNPEFNRVIAALLLSIASNDSLVAEQIENLKEQLFLKTSSGKYLDKKANSVGVDRPPTIGLSDELFRDLVPNLSLKPKQIKKAFYDTADVFWGPLYSRANISANNLTPYSFNIGDTFILRVNDREVQEIKVNALDLAIDGSPTDAEVLAFFSKLEGITPTLQPDPSGNKRLNLRTNTPGSVGSIEILGGTIIDPSKVDLDLKKVEIIDLEQRVAIYNLNPNELIIELPITLPALSRGLKGSHHFHADATIENPVPPENGVWKGSFFFSRTGLGGSNFTLTSQKSETVDPIVRNRVYTELKVVDASKFEESSGYVIFNFGVDQEGPVRYIGKSDANNLLLLDPSYIMKKNHPSGVSVNYLSDITALKPRVTGDDYAIYMTSPSAASNVVRDLLLSLAAAGIIIKFEILAPKFKYLIDTPYISDDNAPNT